MNIRKRSDDDESVTRKKKAISFLRVVTHPKKNNIQLERVNT